MTDKVHSFEVHNDTTWARGGLLPSALAAAVPLWIIEVRGYEQSVREERARICAQHIAEHGDVILFRSKRKGETAEAFNRLAEGLACLAFAPGGVKAFGQHWEAKE